MHICKRHIAESAAIAKDPWLRLLIGTNCQFDDIMGCGVIVLMARA
jgi:hypothetical protein